ncbi:MAG: UDP-N-acetylmuramoyl-tripeptide--D-alanyl-D-alanine ligase [Candidatus Eisenbacteria bacterium]|nr:UDP-N-acetylmuramoyl-tripeptide--D-alanyl-D-alanine ligase [Candidatus Eisenbacteria bacterium]
MKAARAAQPGTLAYVAGLAGAKLETVGVRPADAGRRRVHGACIDTRGLKKGQVFVALRGERADGHDFADRALGAGACAALVRAAWIEAQRERLLPGAALLAADDPQAALQRWARAHRAGFDIPLVAVTGSNGKTTVRAMLAHVLAARGPVLASEGNLNNHLGVPLTLLRLEPRHRMAVVEMGMSHPGEIAALCGIAAPTAGVITNAGRAHLEGLGTVEAVARAKSELVDYLERRGGTAVLNADNEALMAANRGRVSRVRTFGVDAPADVRAVNVAARGLGGSTFRLEGGPEVRLQVPGLHNVRNALAAIAAAGALGVPAAEAAAALAGFRRLEHGRLELAHAGGVQILDDTYNANPDSLAAAVEVLLHTPARGRRMLALGDMLELGGDAAKEHERAGRGLTGLDVVWAAGAHAPDVARGAREAGVAEAHAFEDVGAMVRALPERLRRGDLLLVKGSRGMRMETLVEALKARLA